MRHRNDSTHGFSPRSCSFEIRLQLQRMPGLARTFFIYLRDVNLFSSARSSADQHTLNNQIICTRLFIFSLLFSLIVLITYTSSISILHYNSIDRSTTQNHNQSSIHTHEYPFHTAHSYTVNTPLHRVCSSDFVTDRWITYFNRFGPENYLLRDDFRLSGRYTFRARAFLCSFMSKAI